METEIVETAVTLAMGSGLTLVGFYFLNRQRREPVVDNGNRRVELLEEVAGHVGKVSHVFARYSALISDSLRFAGNIPVKLQEELDQVTSHLVAIFEEISSAESKLLLLGEKRLEKALHLYSGRLAFFRNNYPPGRPSNSDKDIQETKREIARLRDQFYDILSERYDSARR